MSDTTTELAYASAIELAERLRARDLSPVELVEASLARAEALEPSLNAFVTLTPELALDSAREAERALVRGDAGPLAGLPLSVKDLIDVAGVRTTAGSRLTPNTPAAADAPSVERARAAGAAIVGKTTTTEFGAKPGGGDSPLTGVTRNAWRLDRTTGGSSAGSATSIAAGVTPFSITTDGGGSSRVPPALCGVFGIKCQFGRVPVHPVGAIPTLAHVGAMARNVRDAALLLDTIAGYDARDPHSVPAATPAFLSACDADPGRELRVAWSPTLGYARVTDEVRRLTSAAAEAIDALPGFRVELVEQVFDEDPVDMLTAEFYAGAGVKMKGALAQHRELMDPVVADSLEPALRQTIEQYYTQVFARYGLRERVRTFFERYDLLLSPTLPVAAFEAGANVPPDLPGADPNSWVYFTYPFNLTGNPAASIPCGFTDEGLPVGLQLAAPAYDETTLLWAAARYEDATPWHERRPPLAADAA